MYQTVPNCTVTFKTSGMFTFKILRRKIISVNNLPQCLRHRSILKNAEAID